MTATTSPSTVDQILDRWPIRSMAARLGIEDKERGKFRSPFRPDETPSCELYGETIKDRTSGESFDSIETFAQIKGLSNSEAIKQLAAELPGRAPKPQPATKQPMQLPTLTYTQTQAQAVAKLRGLGEASTEMAGAIYGTLAFGKVCGLDCWILTDGSKRIAEARRMDGEKFPAVGDLGERKAHTLKGSCKSWPLGINPPKVTVPDGFPIVLVEGSPDYLSACELSFHAQREFLPVGMLGASQAIHAEALPFFKGRDVLILAHPDDAGTEAARRWFRQLKSIGAKPRAVALTGGDLNDFIKLHGGESAATLLNL